MLPQITPSSDPNRYGEVAAPAGFAGIPLTGILGDQQAAMFGLVCFDPGEAKNTYGTGNFMLLNTGTELVRSSNGLLSTVCYQVGTDKPVYALEGSIAVTGSAVQWLRDQLGIISGAGEIEALAAGVKDNGGVTVNDLCMQLQANVVGVPVSRPLVAETTALGAAYAAGLAIGFWKDTDELRTNWNESRRWTRNGQTSSGQPAMPAGRRPSNARWTGSMSHDREP
jgi:glycerol kinase